MQMNVPHAFVPHGDVMSPTGAPWRAHPAGGGSLEAPLKPVQIQAEPELPPLYQPANTAAAAAAPSAAAASGLEEAAQGEGSAPLIDAAAPPAAMGPPAQAPAHATVDLTGHPPFKAAGKRITSTSDLRLFLESSVARDYIAFVLHVNQACKGQKLSQLSASPSPAVQQLAALLSTLSAWVEEIPPVEQSLRYGNPAFRSWHARLVQRAEQLLRAALPERLHAAVPELAPYLSDSFGNPIRIDYGTGHETTFVALLFCLARLGFVGPGDSGALGGLVFARYVELMRRIQTTYWLEPAGSHGVWGLDDYQFVPFIWGSAQLCGHPMVRPKSIHSAEVLEGCAPEYLYLAAVQFVKKVKKGPLQETSPMMCDISTVPNWEKVNMGMMKMYQAEVLSKLPIMQHFLFGALLPFPAPPPFPAPAPASGPSFPSPAPTPASGPPAATAAAPAAPGAPGEGVKPTGPG